MRQDTARLLELQNQIIEYYDEHQQIQKPEINEDDLKKLEKIAMGRYPYYKSPLDIKFVCILLKLYPVQHDAFIDIQALIMHQYLLKNDHNCFQILNHTNVTLSCSIVYFIISEYNKNHDPRLQPLIDKIERMDFNRLLSKLIYTNSKL